MLHRFTLPARPSPYATPSEGASSHGRALSSSRASPVGPRRSRIFPQESGKENLKSSAVGLAPLRGRRQAPDVFDPADSSTWGVKAPPFLHNGAVFPVSQRDGPRDWHQTQQKSDEDTRLLRSPSLPSAIHLSPTSDDFLKMMDEGLQLDPKQGPLSSAPKPLRIGRSTSSEYPSPSHNSPRVQSPVSTVCVNRLSFSDLSRFGHANDRLSYLRSSSPSSTQDAKADTSHHEAMNEATAAISEWQDEPRPAKKRSYNHYELAESSEVLPCDSLSQQGSPRTSIPDTPTSSTGELRRPKDAAGRTWESIRPIKNEYDGAADSHRPSSPNRSTAPSASVATDAATLAPRRSKRKASQFSLRSLTKPFAKRPRFVGLRRWANKVCHGGSGRLSQAYHRWRRQNEQERRQFEAWKANRRKERPADPLKGKPEKGFGAFSFERSRYGNEEWWREGVAQYRAPSWMLFQK
ncbi:hypothetical protein TOPH_07491 [Tolypocladium ophioglossoides CBS 100239]|uniref:Uncharacterized protein n=1 Tax=Tolypocladium ophioglossoides (strain CBS 100239) TaxID=1163406 RepID=A0A0L0N1G8_TOLOC|nr:hypothetical protein TOPH_07491 [Tolypocladium ophioglossoides CBS 100239]